MSKNKNSLRHIGSVFQSNGYGDFEVVDVLGQNSNGKRLYKIRFVDTGTEKEATMTTIQAGKIRDPYVKSVCGVGVIGPGRPHRDHNREYLLWRSIIRRCYYELNTNYHNYGQKGVVVCESWHYFQNFLSDLPTLPGYKAWAAGETMDLDKDILGNGKLYSPEFCQFVAPAVNQAESGRKPVTDGHTVWPSMSAAQSALGIGRKALLSKLERRELTYVPKSYFQAQLGMVE